jgi:serine phosphatase RsbU (regulator of sigma subunit)
VLGVLHVGTLGNRVFTETDVELLQLVASRVAGAIQTRLGDVELAVADIVQRSLLPSGFPTVAGLDFAARYRPASDIGLGGDWYDVFALPTGDVWLVVGDVAGHGVHAATVMGRLRGTIRAYALTGDAPGEVLARADRYLQQFEPSEMATVVCAAFSPPFDHVTVASAGHLPPVIAVPGNDAAFIDSNRLPPLGVLPDLHRPSAVIPVPAGTLLFLYTDGLVERRHESLDVRLERLRASIVADDPRAACHMVMASLVGETEAEDDIAALAVRRAPQPSG